MMHYPLPMMHFTHEIVSARGDFVCVGCNRTLKELTELRRWNKKHTTVLPICAEANLSFLSLKEDK